MRLADKVIIVTGSSTGIGRSIAERCVQEGAKLVIHGLESDMTHAVAQQFAENSIAVVGDLHDLATIDRLVTSALERFGKIDGLVNNAAMVVTGNINSVTADFVEKLLRVNTIAPLLLIQKSLPHLSKQNGAVVNIGSVNAYCGEPDLLPYSISKGALMTMTRNLGDTLFRDHQVRVNQINPGWILTENEQQRKQEHGLPPNWHQKLPATLAPSGSIIPPVAIAEAAIYWLSDACGPISGQVVDLEQYPMIGRNPPKDGDLI